MYQGKKVITVTPAGRKRYLEILVPYLLQNQHVIDCHRFWVNTTNQTDIDYMESLVSAHPDFFDIEYLPDGCEVNGKNSIYHFFSNCCDLDAVYIRFDDDICYIHENAIENLLKHRLSNPDPFLVYPVIINNCIITHIMQEEGRLSKEIGMAEYTCMGRGWRQGEMAHLAHHELLSKIINGQVDDLFIKDRIFNQYERVSINCICWRGCDFASFEGRVGPDEEAWLASDKPKEMQRPNALCGNAVVAHFAFCTQRHYLENETNDLMSYKYIAPKLVVGQKNE